MLLNTRLFGEIEAPDDIVITFEESLPGLPDSKRYIIMEETRDGKPDELFMWLQSVDEPDIALVLMDVSKVLPNYDPLVDVEAIKTLGEIDTETFYVYNVVVVPEQVERMSVNLRAPIVINDRLKKGRQVLSKNEDHPVRYHILEEMNKKGE